MTTELTDAQRTLLTKAYEIYGTTPFSETLLNSALLSRLAHRHYPDQGWYKDGKFVEGSEKIIGTSKYSAFKLAYGWTPGWGVNVLRALEKKGYVTELELITMRGRNFRITVPALARMKVNGALPTL